jgi:hypothetical protein
MFLTNICGNITTEQKKMLTVQNMYDILKNIEAMDGF